MCTSDAQDNKGMLLPVATKDGLAYVTQQDVSARGEWRNGY